MAALILPIIIFNFAAGIVGGVWLAYLGYWHLLLLGIAAMALGAFAISIALAPSMIVMIPLAASKRVSTSMLLIIPIWFISVGYTYSAMGVWAIAIFWYFTESVTPDAAIPVVMWSYAAATSAWNYMAQKEAMAGNNYSSMSAFFNQIGCVALIIYVLSNFRHIDIYEMAVWFSIPMAVSMVLQVAMIVAESKAHSDLDYFDPLE